MVARLEHGPNGHGLARRLADFLLTAQQADLQQIRPLRLAQTWGADARHVVELCLQAVKEGLLTLRFDLLCPRCRGAKLTVTSLDRLPGGAHCPSCNIDYDADFTRNVELTFQPAAAVRPVPGGEFCLFGPMNTPHVKVQVSLPPGTSRSLPAGLPFGAYRLRTLHPGGEAHIDWHEGGFPEVVVEAETVTAGPPAGPGEVQIRNSSPREQTVIVESRAWVHEALTAHRATTLQAFRDLFSDQVLRPGDDVAIDQVTLMFTDLRGSTELYARIGDARAYRLVREHFAFLGQAVRRHNGAIVKTIGDAVMAAFADPADAVRAALEVQRGVFAFNADTGEEAIVIKLGLHMGPCIAVVLNDRLDYFGSAVNMAARLQGESQGGDIVLSRDLVADPAVRPLFAALDLQEEVAAIKGFGEPVSFLRLSDPVPTDKVD
jgi:class 3 adenylate cyclase/Zn-finger nucleic acid-binding protein